jgi:nitric oxide reductase subunit C
MNNRQARLFAIGCTVVAAIVFLGLTLDSHRQFGELTNAEDITPAVTAGNAVWHDNNCINCHTLFGEGAYYAPDLTKIADHRGDAYLTAYMKDPSRFYDEQIHGRLMPQPNLSDEEIANLIAFLEWVSNVDNQGWPPRPIRVVGGMQMASADGQASGAGAAESAAADTEGPAGRLAAGRDVFRNASPGCQSCHSLQPGADMAGPTLAGIATRAAEILESPDYTGSAESVEGYIRESILEPSAYNVPGAMYSANGSSFMPGTYADSLSDTQVDQLAAWLATFE